MVLINYVQLHISQSKLKLFDELLNADNAELRVTTEISEIFL